MLKTIPQRLASLPPSVRKITAAEARAEIQSNGGTLIDVRETEERTRQPNDAATAIPRGILEMKALEQFKDAEQPLYLHCASGVRAQLAAAQLHDMGYAQVTAIISNITEITDEFNPVENG